MFHYTIGMTWNPSRMLLLNGPTSLARSVMKALPWTSCRIWTEPLHKSYQ